MPASSSDSICAYSHSAAHGDELFVQTAYLTAAYLPPNQTLPGVEPVCSTGHCDWLPYGSLAVCAEVVNLTASTNVTLQAELEQDIQSVIDNSIYSGLFTNANGSGLYPALMIPFSAPSTEFKETPPKTVISQTFVAYSDRLLNLSRRADLAKLQYIGVSLYICTQTFSTDVSNGISNTTEVDHSKIVLSSPLQSINIAWDESNTNQSCPSVFNGSSLVLQGTLNNETFSVDPCTAYELSYLYATGTTGGILLAADHSLYGPSAGQISEALGIALYGGFSSQAIPDPQTQYQNIDLMMQNIARSLTTL